MFGTLYLHSPPSFNDHQAFQYTLQLITSTFPIPTSPPQKCNLFQRFSKCYSCTTNFNKLLCQGIAGWIIHFQVFLKGNLMIFVFQSNFKAILCQKLLMLAFQNAPPPLTSATISILEPHKSNVRFGPTLL